ncbi:MAG: GHKL domain-containing protein [Lachnospiraceae bacterium]|nr:GHKL domain-containing protein [Lachnospiraceae bacterium]
MVRAIYLLFEILAIIVCLFWLFGKKLKITRRMVCVIMIHIGVFIVSDCIGYNSLFSIIVYIVIAGYAGIEFKRALYEILIRVAVMILLCAGIQMASVFLMENLSRGISGTELGNLYVNLITVLIFYILYKKINIQGVVTYIKGEQRKAKILLTGVFCIAVSYILNAKRNAGVLVIDYLLFFMMAIIIVFLIGAWEKYRIQVQEKKIEIEVHEIYADSYKNLIDEIRVRQHEFDNHLQTIINQRYTCHTYEELVRAQSEYICVLSSDNRYNKLLQQGNYVYIGFLYGKLVSLEQQGITIDYRINIASLKSGMPVYKMIEITNDLLNNACEALILPVCIPEPICLWLDESENGITLEVRNIGVPLSMDMIGECFKKGYSKKGNGRGLGLYNVKRIAEQYSALIECRNVMMNQRNWISFMIKIQKPPNG